MLLSVLENYYNSCTIVHLLKVLNCHFLSSCWIFRIFLFYIIIRNFYLFWILALGILQKPCYIHPTHHLSTWPSLWGCLNALYSFTLIPPRSLLLSPSAVDLALKKKKKEKKERKGKKEKKQREENVPIATIKSPICICAYTFCFPFCCFEWTACVFVEGRFFHLCTCSSTLLQEFFFVLDILIFPLD